MLPGRPASSVLWPASGWSFLKDTVPRTTRVACLYDAAEPGSPATVQVVREAAGPLGLTIEALGVQTPDDFDRASEAATRFSADTLFVNQGAGLRRPMPRVVEFAAKNRLPAMYAWRQAVDIGGLMAYGPDTAAMYRRAAPYYVDRILQGASPAGLPVEQPSRFDLIVNLKTAHTLGIAVPGAVLAQATEIVQ